MNDKKLIIAGLVIFIAIALFPFLYNMGKASPAPDPVLTPEAKAAKQCVRSRQYMRADHMHLLDQWRHNVVRDANHIYVSPNGQQYEMSLTRTCLECHSNKAEFCDRCHDYASVRPYCWDCHLDNPKENK